MQRLLRGAAAGPALPLRRPQSTLARAGAATMGAGAVTRRAAGLAAAAAAGAAGALLLARVALPTPRLTRAEGAPEPEPGVALLEKASAHIPGIEEYTRAQVAEHTGPDSIWVTYGSGVYDITEFVKQHPGGAKRIMLAAGKGLEPFWRIYQQHFGEGASTTVAEHLTRMRIANLVPGEGDEDLAMDSSDPFSSEPTARHPSLKVWSKRAFNAEAPADLIGDTWITPTDLFCAPPPARNSLARRTHRLSCLPLLEAAPLLTAGRFAARQIAGTTTRSRTLTQQSTGSSSKAMAWSVT